MLFIHIDLLAYAGQKRRLQGVGGVGGARFSEFIGEETENILLPGGRLFASTLRRTRERVGWRFAWGRGLFLSVAIVRAWPVIIGKILRWGRRLQQSVVISGSSHSATVWYWFHAVNGSRQS